MSNPIQHFVPAKRVAYDSVKRALDVCLSSLLLVLTSPLMLVVALVVRIGLGTPIVFRQTRPGREGNPFVLFKFRTMREAVEESGTSLSDAERLTTLGQWLRSTSLDELPELVNVWRGDMSFVGPRPLLMEYLPLFSRRQARRHEVRPGITGLSQIRGRNLLEWADRFELDVWYVENRSLKLDIKILLETVKKVITREGISEAGQSTMTQFRGN